MKIRRKDIWAALLLTLVIAGSALAQSGDPRLATKFKEATEAQRAGRLDEAVAAYSEVIKMRPGLKYALPSSNRTFVDRGLINDA